MAETSRRTKVTAAAVGGVLAAGLITVAGLQVTDGGGAAPSAGAATLAAAPVEPPPPPPPAYVSPCTANSDACRERRLDAYDAWAAAMASWTEAMSEWAARHAEGEAPPTPTPSPTDTPTESPSPSPSPTSPSSSASPTNSTPSSASPSPTPTGSGEWPNATNTGPRVPDSQLTPSGPLTITQDGAVITNRAVNGDITVLADNVTIRDTKVLGGRIATGYGSEQSGLLVEYVEIDGQNSNSSWSAIGDVNYTARYLDIHNFGNGPRAGDNVTVENTWVHDLCCYSAGDHRTAFGSNGGSNVTVRGNSFNCSIGGCSAALSIYGQWTSNNVLLERNRLISTDAAVYCMYAGGQFTTNLRVINNLFVQSPGRPQCGSGGAVVKGQGITQWAGNVFSDGSTVN